jgi:hypothetical protein
MTERRVLSLLPLLILVVLAGPVALGQWAEFDHERRANTDEVVVYGSVEAFHGERGDAVLYLYDDGSGNTNIGPPSTFDPDMLWGNYFLTEEGGEVITEVSVAFGPTFPSLASGPVTFWILDDPDVDLDPRNATSLASVEGTPNVFGNTFFSVDFPPTEVSGAFFVGASAKLLGGQDRPARVDTGARADRSWFFYAPDIAEVIDDLASAPFGTRMDNPEFVPFPGAFMVRAVGIPKTTTSTPPEGGAGESFVVRSSHPNPLVDVATIEISLARSEHVSMGVYDLKGRRVATLLESRLPSGTHAVRWDASGVAAGVYVVRALSESASGALRVTVVR